MKLIIKLFIGIIFGIIIGNFAPDFIVQILITVKSFVSQLIKFIIPLLILFYVTSGISGLPKNSGKLLTKTVGTAYLSTLFAGIFSFTLASNLFPSLLHKAGSIPKAETVLTPFLNIEIPPVMNIMTALTIAFIFGIGISHYSFNQLKTICDQGRDIVEMFLNKIMIPALPYYIAGVFADVTAKGTVFATLKAFSLVLLAIIIMHWIWLAIQFSFAGTVLKRSPLNFLKVMLPAYFTAVGTMSSAATVPVTLRQTKENGVSDSVANFVVPLCANIHMSGSAISIAGVSVAVMLMTGTTHIIPLTEALPFLAMLGITMVAAPGAPGGAVMASVGLLGTMLGFTEEMIALQIILHLAQDSFGTACNVTGDGVIALLIDKITGPDSEKVSELEQPTL